MVVLISENQNPTMFEIDAYISKSKSESRFDIQATIREIECKSGAGALLHPAESYFLERAAAAAAAAITL
jgi:hypothetical protein